MATFDYGKTADAQSANVQHVVLHGVQRVFPTKNPKLMVMSMEDKSSESGFGNIVLNTPDFTKNGDGTYDVDLGPENRWREVSVKRDGGYVTERRDVRLIEQQFESTKVHHVEQQADTKAKEQSAPAAAAPVQKDKPAKNVYMNMVPAKLIKETSNPNVVVVSIPMKESENGFGRMAIGKDKVFPAKDMKTGQLVTNCRNVNLGDPSRDVKYSIKEGGTFVSKTMPAQALADYQKQQRQEYLQSLRDSAKEAPVEEASDELNGAEMEDDDDEMLLS